MMSTIHEQAPPWGQRALELADDHPGREDNEVGISTLTYDGSLTYRRLKGRPVPDPEDDGSMTKGTYLHWLLYHFAPNAETKVRVKIKGTDLYLAGHFDAFDTGILRDLKTSDKYDLSDARWESIMLQIRLYAYCVEHGEAWDPDEEEWVPAKEYLDTDGVEEVVVDFWGAQGLKWRYREESGADLEQGMNGAYAWACQQVKDMLADNWTPPTTEQAEAIETPEAPDDIQEAIQEAGRAKELKDQHEAVYDEERAGIYEALHGTDEEPGPRESVTAGSYMAVYNKPSTKEVLDVNEAETFLDAGDKDLSEFQDERKVARVTDEERLAEVLIELGLDDMAGVKIDTERSIDEDELRETLAGIETPDEEGAENALEVCLKTEQTRSGHVYVKNTGDS